jgi:hypothetical protein
LHLFFAPTHLRAGGSWSAQLAQEIAEATAFVLLVAEHGIGNWQVLEYDEALDKWAIGIREQIQLQIETTSRPHPLADGCAELPRPRYIALESLLRQPAAIPFPASAPAKSTKGTIDCRKNQQSCAGPGKRAGLQILCSRAGRTSVPIPKFTSTRVTTDANFGIKGTLVWRFRSPQHSRGESELRTSEPKPH